MKAVKHATVLLIHNFFLSKETSYALEVNLQVSGEDDSVTQ